MQQTSSSADSSQFLSGVGNVDPRTSAPSPTMTSSQLEHERIERLARLALADEELNADQVHQRNRGKDMSGSDILFTAITDSIIVKSYAAQLRSSKSTNENVASVPSPNHNPDIAKG